jgi:hypothetical protein
MKLKCSKCESNVVQMLLGVDDRRFKKCLGCGMLAEVKRAQAEADEPKRPLALSRLS